MDGTKPMPSAAESDASGARETAKRPRDDAAAAAEDAMIRRYLEKQAQAIEDRHRSDLAKIADTNAKICVEIKILRRLRAESSR